jgi:hypothetical protein
MPAVVAAGERRCGVAQTVMSRRDDELLPLPEVWLVDGVPEVVAETTVPLGSFTVVVVVLSAFVVTVGALVLALDCEPASLASGFGGGT